MTRIHRTACAALLGLFMSTFAFGALAASLTEPQKIQMLIHDVETLKDAKFIRNGSAHDGAAAADHLRLKLRNAGSRVKTAEDFITCCASKSSFSGKPYRIRFADGHEMDSAQFFHTKLAEIEHSASAIRPVAPTSVSASPAPVH